jgi:hypothetical protein
MRPAVTRATIELLSALNEARSATEDEVACGFACVFLCMHAFAACNEIDSQQISEYLQSTPFLSPFCILALLNHIPPTVPLFAFLSSFKSGSSVSESRQGAFQYVIVDLSKPGKFGKFVELIPNFFSQYLSGFTWTPPIDTKAQDSVVSESEDEDGFMAGLQCPEIHIFKKMKAVLNQAGSRELGPVHVCCMGIDLLRVIALSLLGHLHECVENGLFTKSFRRFASALFSLFGTSFAGPMAEKLYDDWQRNPGHRDLGIRCVISLFLPNMLRHGQDNRILPFCVTRCTATEFCLTAQLLVWKILQCGPRRLTPRLKQALEISGDFIILLEVVDSLTDFDKTYTADEALAIQKERAKLLSRLPVTEWAMGYPFLVIEKITTAGDLERMEANRIYGPILNNLRQWTLRNATVSLSQLGESGSNIYVVLKILIFLKFISDNDFAGKITKLVCGLLLHTEYNEGGALKFEIRPCDYGLVLAEALLVRLLYFRFTDLACELLLSMKPLLIVDSIALHYLSRVLSRFGAYLAPGTTPMVSMILQELPCASVLLGKSVREIADILISREQQVIQPPDVFLQEYFSPYEHAYTFSLCSLSFVESGKLGLSLAKPLATSGGVWERREDAAIALAKLAAGLSDDTGYRYFELMLGSLVHDVAVKAGQTFIMSIGTRLLSRIATSAASLIGKSDSRLTLYTEVMIVGFPRLFGALNECGEMIVGLLESAQSVRVQEIVVDLVGILFVELGLWEMRQHVLEAGKRLSPQLRQVLEYSVHKDLLD